MLFYETGQFANLWRALAQRLGLNVEVVGKPGKDSWRWGVDAVVIEERLRNDAQHDHHKRDVVVQLLKAEAATAAEETVK